MRGILWSTSPYHPTALRPTPPGNLVTEGPGWQGAARLQPPAPPSQTSGPGAVVFNDSAWQRLTLPHDYLAWGAPNDTAPAPHQAEHGVRVVWEG